MMFPIGINIQECLRHNDIHKGWESESDSDQEPSEELIRKLAFYKPPPFQVDNRALNRKKSTIKPQSPHYRSPKNAKVAEKNVLSYPFDLPPTTYTDESEWETSAASKLETPTDLNENELKTTEGKSQAVNLPKLLQKPVLPTRNRYSCFQRTSSEESLDELGEEEVPQEEVNDDESFTTIGKRGKKLKTKGKLQGDKPKIFEATKSVVATDHNRNTLFEVESGTKSNESEIPTAVVEKKGPGNKLQAAKVNKQKPKKQKPKKSQGVKKTNVDNRKVDIEKDIGTSVAELPKISEKPKKVEENEYVECGCGLRKMKKVHLEYQLKQSKVPELHKPNTARGLKVDRRKEAEKMRAQAAENCRVGNRGRGNQNRGRFPNNASMQATKKKIKEMKKLFSANALSKCMRGLGFKVIEERATGLFENMLDQKVAEMLDGLYEPSVRLNLAEYVHIISFKKSQQGLDFREHCLGLGLWEEAMPKEYRPTSVLVEDFNLKEIVNAEIFVPSYRERVTFSYSLKNSYVCLVLDCFNGLVLEEFEVACDINKGRQKYSIYKYILLIVVSFLSNVYQRCKSFVTHLYSAFASK